MKLHPLPPWPGTKCTARLPGLHDRRPQLCGRPAVGARGGQGPHSGRGWHPGHHPRQHHHCRSRREGSLSLHCGRVRSPRTQVNRGLDQTGSMLLTSCRAPGEMGAARLGARWAAASSVKARFARAFSAGAGAPHPDRKALLDCKRVVLKVGTAVVSNPNGTLVCCAPRASRPAHASTHASSTLHSRHARVMPVFCLRLVSAGRMDGAPHPVLAPSACWAEQRLTAGVARRRRSRAWARWWRRLPVSPPVASK